MNRSSFILLIGLLTLSLGKVLGQTNPATTVKPVKADRIYLRDQSTLETIITEVTESEIKYRRFSNPTGPVFSVRKDNISVIVYANGESESFGSTAPVAGKATAEQPKATPQRPSSNAEPVDTNPATNRLVITKLSNGRQYTFKSGDVVRLKNDDDSYGGNFSSYRLEGVTREKLLLTAGGTDYGMPYRNISGIKHKGSNALQNILRFGGGLLSLAAYTSSRIKADRGSYTYYGTTYYSTPLTWEVPAYVVGASLVITSLFVKKPYLKFTTPNRYKWEVLPENSNQGHYIPPIISTR